jgi:hypothetical protein
MSIIIDDISISYIDDSIAMDDRMLRSIMYHAEVIHGHTRLCPFPCAVPVPFTDERYSILFQFYNNHRHGHCARGCMLFNRSLIYDSILCTHKSIQHYREILLNRDMVAVEHGDWTVSILYPNQVPYTHMVHIPPDMCTVMDVIQLVYSELSRMYALDRCTSSDQLVSVKEDCKCDQCYTHMSNDQYITLDADWICPICMQTLDDTDTPNTDTPNTSTANDPNNLSTMTGCVHIFHTSCISEWFRRKPTCPICRDTCNRCNGNKYICELRRAKCVLPRGNKHNVNIYFLQTNGMYNCMNIHMSELVLLHITVDRTTRTIRPIFDTNSDPITHSQIPLLPLL